MTRGSINIGPRSPSGEGRHFSMPQPNFPTPERIANSGQREAYAPPEWQIRSGGRDHEQYKSLPLEGWGTP